MERKTLARAHLKKKKSKSVWKKHDPNALTRRWTQEADDFLRANYLHLSVSECAKHLGKRGGAVRMRARLLGILKRPRKPWTLKEDNTLRKLYLTHGARHVAALLQRHERSLAERAKKLGLKRKAHRWQPEEDAYLRRWFGRRSNVEIGKTLSRSPSGVVGRATIIGLRQRTIVRRWTPQEDAYIRQWDGMKQRKQIAKELRRPLTPMIMHMKKMGMYTPLRKLWAPKEVVYLKQWYRRKSVLELSNELQCRERSVQHKLKRLLLWSKRKKD